MAGLVPALREGAVPGSEGSGPTAHGAFGGSHARHSRRDWNTAAPRGRLHRTAPLLLVIDQFEELFALADRDEQRRFLHDLVTMCPGARPSVRVVLTLRADALRPAPPRP